MEVQNWKSKPKTHTVWASIPLPSLPPWEFMNPTFFVGIITIRNFDLLAITAFPQQKKRKYNKISGSQIFAVF